MGQTEVFMAEGVNVRFPKKLRVFVEERTNGLYGSASEYIRELVRRDYEIEEAKRFERLKRELAPGMEAADEEFIPVSAEEVMQRNRP